MSSETRMSFEPRKIPRSQPGTGSAILSLGGLAMSTTCCRLAAALHSLANCLCSSMLGG